MALMLVECNHFWLEVEARPDSIVAICNRKGCGRRCEFTREEWFYLSVRGWCMNKPKRI